MKHKHAVLEETKGIMKKRGVQKVKKPAGVHHGRPYHDVGDGGVPGLIFPPASVVKVDNVVNKHIEDINLGSETPNFQNILAVLIGEDHLGEGQSQTKAPVDPGYGGCFLPSQGFNKKSQQNSQHEKADVFKADRDIRIGDNEVNYAVSHKGIDAEEEGKNTVVEVKEFPVFPVPFKGKEEHNVIDPGKTKDAAEGDEQGILVLLVDNIVII
jgi:hypothetical protein